MLENLDAGSDTQTDVEDVATAEGAENVEAVNSETPEEAALRVLNQATGEQFKDLETAQKSIGELKSYTGMKKEDVAKKLEETGEYVKASDLDSKLEGLQAAMRDNTFFEKNADLAPFRSVIETVAKANNQSVEEAVKDPVLSQVLEGKKEYDNISAQKTVMESNPRTLQANTKMEEAKKAAATGDQAKLESQVGGALMDHIAALTGK